MTLEANLRTTHGVPLVPECGSSGSIVFRTIVDRRPLKEVQKKITASDKARVRAR